MIIATEVAFGASVRGRAKEKLFVARKRRAQGHRATAKILRELRFEGWLGAEALRALWGASSLSGLAVLEILFSLQESDEKTGGPVLTLPVGG